MGRELLRVGAWFGVWVRPPRIPLASAIGSTAGGAYDVAGLGLRLDVAYQATAGSGSEFAINEFTGPGKPVVEAHFYDVRSLQVYLTRAAKDPNAPKKLRLYLAGDYPWDKAKIWSITWRSTRMRSGRW